MVIFGAMVIRVCIVILGQIVLPKRLTFLLLYVARPGEIRQLRWRDAGIG